MSGSLADHPTGATAVQVVPELAKWADQLIVFQRTPSAVDQRDNRDTDPVEWKTKIATKPGWQRQRNDNFNAFVNNHPQKPADNLVDDGWTRTPT
jgi:cation diffusion facilitator CzcD-associated flavoprotein CzcO